MDNLKKTDEFLLEAVAQGSELAFADLFYSYKNKVYTIAMLFTKNENDAEEVVQDVFSRIWKYRSRLSEVENFPAWIVTVTKRRSLTLLKKIAREQLKREALQQIEKEHSIVDTESHVGVQEVQGLLRSALKLLTPQQRRVFELSRLRGMDRKSVAKSLGLSPATVSVHLTVALRRVRAFLYDHSYEILLIILFSFLR